MQETKNQDVSIKTIGTISAKKSIKELENNLQNINMEKSFVNHTSSKELQKHMQNYFKEPVVDLITSSRYVAHFVKDAILINDTNHYNSYTFTFTYKPLFIKCHVCITFPQKKSFNDRNSKKANHKNNSKVLLFQRKKEKEETQEIIETIVYTFSCIYNSISLLKSNHIFNPSYQRNINIYCFMLDKKRELPLNQETIGKNNINAGFSTFSNIYQSDIFIYRIQHINKVIIHEIIHALHFDAGIQLYYDQQSEYIEKEIKQVLHYNLHLSKKLESNETFTELLACFWHLFFTQYKNRHVKYHPISYYWKKENALYHNICKKIIAYYASFAKLTFEYNDKNMFLKDISMKETSHLFSYYFGKTALWSCLDKCPICLNNTYYEDSSIFSNEKYLIDIFLNLYKNACLSDSFWAKIIPLQFMKKKNSMKLCIKDKDLSMTLFS